MSGWQNSSRRDELPPGWKQIIRPRILRRDGWKCQWRMTSSRKCGQPANQVDHVIPGNDHSDENLQSLCEWHHGKKSGGEGGRASQQSRAQHRNKFRRTEAHPGLL